MTMCPSAADLAKDPENFEDAIPEADPIAGNTQQLTLDVGGQKVTVSEFKLQGGSVPVEGQFKKGERVRLVVEAVVGKVEFEDRTDGAGVVTACTRRHVAKMESVRRAGPEAVE